MSDLPFDMPPPSAGFPARGRWLIDRLMPLFDLTEEQAAGIVGNLGLESVGLTKLHEIGQPEGKGGYGWAQWTAERRVMFFGWCRARGFVSPTDQPIWQADEANYGFLVYELQTSHAYVLEPLHRATHLEGAVFEFGRLYEAPGGTTETHLPGFDGRLDYARQALAGPVATAPIPQHIPAPTDDDGIELTIAEFTRVTTELQTKLKARGLYKHALDGIWGGWSNEALAAYRRGRG